MSKHWWCPTCKIEVAPYNVTNDERHEQCGCPVEWVEEGAAPRDDLQVRIRELEEQVARMREALQEVTTATGAFSRNAFTHAENCIEAMKAIAQAALDAAGGAS